MNTLHISHLGKTYANGVCALRDVSLTISDGMFGLLGANGAGKSSLMRTIAGLQTPDTGTITFNGIDTLANPLHIKACLGYLPQEFGVYPNLSAYRLLEHIAVLKGLTSKPERHEQICALLEQTNLYQHRDKSVHTFSGGMRQRFGIAQALLGAPQLIIVDEPTAGLDPEERNRFNNLLSEIGENIIVILSTHIVEDVRDLCTQMAIIADGAVIAEGSPSAFVDELRGKVWTKAIPKRDIVRYKGEMQVLSSRLNAGSLAINVLADEQPEDGFTPCLPSLEDVYFKTLSGSQRSSYDRSSYQAEGVTP
jgi:ABC-2 type transport system ATP-binding protein